MKVVSCVLFETYSKQVLPSLQECHWKAYCAFKRCMYSTVLKGVVHTSSEECACVCLTMKLCFGAKVLPHEKPALLEKAAGTNRADCTSELSGRFKEAQHLLKGQLLLRLQPKKIAISS